MSVGRELHRITHALGDAEVGQEHPLRLAVRRGLPQQDVGRLDVAVEQAVAVGIVKR